MPAATSTSADRELNLADVVGIMRRDWRLIAVVVFICAVASVVYALLAQQWYRADVVLKPADSKQTQGLLGQLGGLSGLAGLAGLNFSDNRTSESIAVLKSRELIGGFIEEQNLLPVLFADKWDANTKRWKSDDPVKQPDVRDGVKYFLRSVFSLQEDKKNGLVTITVDWKDGPTAAAWADMLVARVNEVTRNRALALAEYNVNYLKQELASSTVVAMQQSIGRVLESELQKLLLAKADKEYAFKTLDHAQAPRLRYWPKRTLLVIGAVIVGFFGSALFCVSREVMRRNNAAT
jgi:uncharacterized protein involved in exopolysaccharide biosynthesis